MMTNAKLMLAPSSPPNVTEQEPPREQHNKTMSVFQTTGAPLNPTSGASDTSFEDQISRGWMTSG